MKTFSTSGLKPQGQDKEKEKEDKKKENSATVAKVPSTKKGKSKPSKEGKKKKKRKAKSLSPILEKRRTSKRRVVRLAEESSSSFRAENEVSAITAKPTILADTITTIAAPPVSRAIRSALRGVV